MDAAERNRLHALLTVETALRPQGYVRIAGVDEAGRGPLAGPLVCAACILPHDLLIEGLNDSKQLTARRRETLFEQLICLEHAIEVLSVEEIDRLNIYRATMVGMARAVQRLNPSYALIDGNRCPPLTVPAQPLVQGDARSLTIAAASVLAKVTRDRLMVALDKEHPQYGFATHKGYGTEAHLEALRRYGPTPHHRRTFAPVKSLLNSL